MLATEAAEFSSAVEKSLPGCTAGRQLIPQWGSSGLIFNLIGFYICKRDIINLNVTFLFDHYSISVYLLRLLQLKEMEDKIMCVCFADSTLWAVAERCPGRHKLCVPQPPCKR